MFSAFNQRFVPPRLISSLLVGLSALALTLGLGAAPASAQDLTELVRTSKHAVVALRVFDGFGQVVGTGSGFFIDPEGLVVTNYHVIEHGSRIEVVLSDKRTLNVLGTRALDKAHDLAMLQIDTPHAVPTLSLADALPEEGQKIVVLGNPRGLTFSTTEGIISAIRTEDDLPEDLEVSTTIQFSAPISPGSSGSPLMNLEGRVVGVVVSQITNGQNLNFAIPASRVAQLLSAASTSATAAPLGSGLAAVATPSYLANLTISLLFFGGIYLGFRYLR